MTTLSTHVLDTERGVPAAGVPVGLYRGEWSIASAHTNADGRIIQLADIREPGGYRLVFEVGRYFEAHGQTAPFLERLTVEFRVSSSDAHYHIPLLLSPYACTTYRGS